MRMRMPKAYLAYFGTYGEFKYVKDYADSIEKLFLIGRNGMHRYNSQDHSMLTARLVVENIVNGVKSKQNIWDVNIDDDVSRGRWPSFGMTLPSATDRQVRHRLYMTFTERRY